MTAVAVTLRRARRIAQIFAEVRGQTGSLRAASLYTYRYTVSKLPRLLRRIGGKAARRSTPAARASVPAGTALLALKIGGGLGDYIVIARFLRDLAAKAGPLVFDIYANNPGQARWVFGSIAGLRDCCEDIGFETARDGYDLALTAVQIVSVANQAGLSGALAAAARSIEQAARKFAPFLPDDPRSHNFLAQTLVFSNATRRDAMHRMAGLSYGGDALKVPVSTAALERNGLRPGRYVTVHNGFDPQFFVVNRRATKCYPHFGEVVRLLKQQRPDLRVVQIGTGTSEKVPGADLDLIGATSIAEAAGLVANARLHIDNEGGLVHLASCFGVTSCVVFGPTPANYFGYPGNLNISPAFCGGCWWMTETWMDTCPRGFATPRCLSEQDPAVVVAAILRFLEQDAEAA